MTDTPISLAEIGGRDQIGRDWLAGQHSLELPDAKWLAVVTAEERDALVEAVESDIALEAAAAASAAAWRGVSNAPELGTQKRRDALEAAFAADKVYASARDRHAAALSRFVSEQTPNGDKSSETGA